MNRLVKFSSFSLTRQVNSLIKPSNRFLSSKKPPSKEESEQIKVIETNEEKYFENVKESFDKLQKNRENESLEEKRSRLMYQSRKRGTLENGLLLSHFSAKYLPEMNEKHLNEYDKIINSLHNEWDLYYWLTGANQVPEELKSSEVLQMMKKYSANDLKQSRIVQPDLKF